MPERFDLTYIGADDAPHRPVMIHRALLGSMERFAGILIEHYAGRFPAWLAPVQAIVLPVSDRHNAYARRVATRAARGRRAGRRSTSARSRSARRSATPSWAATRTCWWSATARRQSGALAVRSHAEGELGAMPVAEFAELRPRSRARSAETANRLPIAAVPLYCADLIAGTPTHRRAAERRRARAPTSPLVLLKLHHSSR